MPQDALGKPPADKRLQLLDSGSASESRRPRRPPDRGARVAAPQSSALRSLWRGEQPDSYGLFAVIDTTAAALMALEAEHSVESARDAAQGLWEARARERLG